ncbi:hypothetical protein [Curtobacterium sp. Leaf261]|uniref:hypothetical protein n=1 Tax=Curtobacterium sp. Leaf261 TaxID=1736311 RepID=UPI0006F63701|nr:hypothetical protein [Curtobacterium sp. Leaf261]KQO63659.1 hypothetical protein ASF23_05380 [Curtobacterium sp. Leaf261]
MTVQTIADIVIGLALVGFLMYRQATWQFLDAARIWRMPVILGAIGVITIAKSSGGPITSMDVAFLGAEVVLSVAVGLLMGNIAHFRVAARPDDKGRSLQTRTGGLGAVLWIVLIAVRVGMDVVGAGLGVHLLSSTGMILVMIAVNRAARALVLDRRIPAHVRAGA